MNMDQVARAFDKWMDDYTNDPEAFEDMTKTALTHLRERLDGKEPTYGQSSAANFMAYYDSAGDGLK